MLQARCSGTSSPPTRSRRTRSRRARTTHGVVGCRRPPSPGSRLRQPLRIANGASTIAATPKRKSMYPTGVTSMSAFCTSLNVEPYAIVAAINASSGRSGRRVSHAAGRAWPRFGSAGPAIGDRQPPILPERLGRHAHTRRRLPALVLVAIDERGDAPDDGRVEAPVDQVGRPRGRPRRSPRGSGRARRSRGANRCPSDRVAARRSAAS